MTYERINFVDQSVERPRTYEMTQNADGSVTLIDSFGLVDELGTPINADTMNHLEDGIASNEARITILEDIPALRNMATGSFSLAIGDTTTSTANKYSVVIGKGSKTTGDSTIAIGYNTTASSGIVIGRGISTTNSASIAIGGNASASNAISIGSGLCSGQYGLAIGEQTEVSGKYAIGLGYNADATAENAIQFGKGTNSTANTMQVMTYPLLDLSTGKIPMERLDNSFVAKNAILDTTVTTGEHIIDLSEYLPDDGYNYEILCIYNFGVATSANVYIYSDIVEKSTIALEISDSGRHATGFINIPIGTERKLYLNFSKAFTSGTTRGIEALGYRKVG